MEGTNQQGGQMPQSSGNQQPQQRSFLKRYGFAILVLLICLIMGAYILMQETKQEELKNWGPGTEFAYTDLQGNEVTLSNTNGKARLLYFFFASCPDVCPPTTFVMSQVQDKLKEDGLFGDKVQFLSVSIDPNRDTQEVLEEYSNRFNADPEGWKFLRGDEEETAALARKYQILVEKTADGNFAHMNLIVLLDKDGNIREWISANDYIETGDGQEKLTPNDMAKLIRRVL